MYGFLATLLIIASILTVLIVLIQNPKGGGIAANFSNIPTQLMGVKKTTDVVERLTWGFVIAIFVISLATNFAKPDNATGQRDTKVREQIDNSALPQQQMPQAPAGATDSTKKQ